MYPARMGPRSRWGLVFGFVQGVGDLLGGVEGLRSVWENLSLSYLALAIFQTGMAPFPVRIAVTLPSLLNLRIPT